MTFPIKRGDTRPEYVATLSEVISGTPTLVDLTTATSVRLLLRARTGAAPIVAAAASVTTALSGLVTYTWAPGDTDHEPGLYLAEWEVTWGDGGIQTFPSEGHLLVKITESLL